VVRISTLALLLRVSSCRVASIPSRFDADVHEHDVGIRLRGAGDGLLAIRRLADDLDVRLGVEDQAKAGADERLVVDEQNPDHAAGAAARGGVRAR
jgi:hypothetical protein